MGKIIKFDAYRNDPEYLAQIREVRNKIKEMEYAVDDLIIDVATKGAWREWNKEQEVGTVFNFSEDALSKTDDCNVDTLLNLRDMIIMCQTVIKEDNR